MIDVQKSLEVEVTNFDGSVEKKYLLIHPWGVFKAGSRIPQIGRVIATPMSIMMSSGDDWKDALPMALSMLFDELEANDPEQFFTMLFDEVYYEKEHLNIEQFFGTDLSAMCFVAAEVIKLNYGTLITGKGLSSLFKNMGGLAQVTSHSVNQPQG